MAIDTAARRHSAFDPGIPWRVGLIPDLTINAADRRALVQMYAGLAAGNNYSIEAEYGSFEMTGSDVEMTPTTGIDSDVDRFAAMNIGNPWRGINLVPTGSVGRTQRQILAGFYTPYASGPTYTLEAESGAFVWDGEPSFSDFEITGEYGDFVMTGNDATLIATRGIVCESGVFAMTGSDSDLRVLTEQTLIPEPGIYVMTGSDVTFTRPRTLEASGTAFEMTGYEIPLIYTNERGQEFEGSVKKNQEAGRPKKRKKHQVEIEGQVYEADSEAEALYMLEKVKEQAEAAAKLALERANKALKKPLRKILQDARKALQPPIVESDELPTEAEQILKQIDDLYKDTLMKVEIAALLRKQEEEEEEAILLMLV
jgi:hypothetical protein